MTQSQSAILPQPSRSALFLVLRVRDHVRNAAAVARVVARVPSLTVKLGALDRRARLVSAVGIGAEFWDKLSPGKRPRGLRPFKPLTADGRSAPSTGGDLLFHIISERHDLNFELVRKLRADLGDAAQVMDEIHGFRYLDSRDLTGFIDGTENPKGRDRARAAIIGEEDRDFVGGSYAFTQRYVHDLERWAAIEIKEQERVVGRRKQDSKELSDRLKPPTAHISRVVIEEGGEELQIVRHSFPYGTVSEAGLYFVAYCRTLDIPERMLSRMMGTAGDGSHDRLMEFSKAVTGATFFAPSLTVLKSLV